MQRETLTYQADGLTMKSELFFEPSGGPRTAVLVFPEAYGLNKHALERAERLASLGYATRACDLHGAAKVVTNPIAANAKRYDAVRYSAEADKRSWKTMQDLFAEAFA
jgi:hypothetical protein